MKPIAPQKLIDSARYDELLLKEYRLSEIDAVLREQLKDLDFKNRSMITLEGNEYERWARSCFFLVGSLNERRLLPEEV